MLQIANEEIITCAQFLGLDSPLLCGFIWCGKTWLFLMYYHEMKVLKCSSKLASLVLTVFIQGFQIASRLYCYTAMLQ